MVLSAAGTRVPSVWSRACFAGSGRASVANHRWPSTSANHAASTSARAAAGHPAPGRQGRGLALYALRNSRHSRRTPGGRCAGPSAVNLLHLHLFDGGQATVALMLLGQVGAMFLMFMAGVETDIERMREASVTAFVVA